MKKMIYGFCLIFAVILLSACFSPWQGEGKDNLTIVWGNDSYRAFVSEVGKTDLVTVSLTGPGETITESFMGTSSSAFTVIPGTWNVNVKVYERKVVGKRITAVLKAMGIEQVEVKAGESVKKKFYLYTATEISSWADLKAAVAGNDPLYHPKTNNRQEMFLLTGSMRVNCAVPGVDAIFMDVTRPIVLVAETDVMLTPSEKNFRTRLNDTIGSNPAALKIISLNPTLLIFGEGYKNVTIGKDGMNGTISFSY